MTLIRPRLNDYYELPFAQKDVDFAIPFLDEDLPLWIDPFLLWKSPSQQDQALHTSVVNSFNNLVKLAATGAEKSAIELLIVSSECDEVSLGHSGTRRGRRINRSDAEQIVATLKGVPHIRQHGFVHFEEIQLYVDRIGADRISDMTANFIKSFLIDYTLAHCQNLSIPRSPVQIANVYDYSTHSFKSESLQLPCNPNDHRPLLFVPRRWLRQQPWINFDDFFGYALKQDEIPTAPKERISIITYNRHQAALVAAYVAAKEKTQASCNNDPLFTQIPITSAKRKLKQVLALPSGKSDSADRKYEDFVCQMLASMLYPDLDFAQEQSRTDSGTLIRDLIFYNNRSHEFLRDVYDAYVSRQLVFELKNVKAVEREHVNQLNRYLTDQLGRFGVLVTRHDPPRAIFKNTIDLWSGQRRCIVFLTDADLSMMTEVFESKQRAPIDVLKKKYVEFVRACPA